MTTFIGDDHMGLFFSKVLTANSNFCLPPVLAATGARDFTEFFIELDQALFEWILVHVNPGWLVKLAGFLAADSTLAVIALALWLLYFTRNRRMALYLLPAVLIALGLSDATASILKETFERVRPVTWYEIFHNPYTFSFPSAHAMNSMTLAALLWMHFQKKGGYFLLFPFFIGACRVITHYHFPGDVLGGWFFGALLGAALGRLWLLIRVRLLPPLS